MRLIVCDNGLSTRLGHHYNLDLALREEGRRRGLDLEIWGLRNTPPDILAELDAKPVFRDSTYLTRSRDRAVGLIEDMLTLGLRFAEDLDAAGVRAEDVVFLPMARANEIYGLGAWLSCRQFAPPIALCLNFMMDDPFQARTDRPAWLRPALYRYATGRLASLAPAPRILLTSGSEGLATALGAAISQEVHPFPMPKAYPAARPARQATVPTVSFLGDPKPIKGFCLLPEIFSRARAAGATCNFVVQVSPNRNYDGVAETTATLAARGDIRLVREDLTRPAYYDLLGEADVILLPYDHSRYGARTSGIFAESLALGRVVVAPVRTWMADQLGRGHGAGVCFDGFNAEAVAAALLEALARLPALTAAAQVGAPTWRRAHSIEGYMDRLLGALRPTDVDVAPAREPLTDAERVAYTVATHADVEIASLRRSLTRADERAAAAEERASAILNSTIWRGTAPLRRLIQAVQNRG